MVLTSFNGAGVGFGFGVGCGFGIGWGFGGMPLSILGLGAGGGCGVGFGLGWGFGTGYGGKYHTSTLTFQGVEFDRKSGEDRDSKKQLKNNLNRMQVLDVSKFLNEHPGGEEALLEYAGKDATKGFDDTGHSKEAHKIMLRIQVGFLQGYGGKKIEDSSEEQLPKLKDMEAYVIKEDPKSKYVVFIEFWVPIFAAVLYFGYRCMTGAVNFQS